ncbi:aromatic ring-hydroxylating dioxygenase subunit alpha [Roseofilum casamattae]|uniref:Aromatic ring-hydroxylating dioxygenase subunit alpha n=1 Tax=Roseofilum casamattae BLCC-M143 TaxID=3022442 RepID=A0ABT7C0G5_9CYAN|nr:aromatic ring-hydroxylating dioxygenase subunit alpha [Roseofilum casamattae]MDJ1184948.1 aromatic ring-hydroxylating dioxygenase subunit alpha [Roseofilum casamattae BLCC-M143]
MSELLHNFWYTIAFGKDLKPGQMLSKRLLGEPIVIGRHKDGRVFALRNICPHRGIPFSHGWVEDNDVRCCYHGWCFNTQNGTCSEIPSLTEYDGVDISRIQVPAYPCREVQGNIWVYVPQSVSDLLTLDRSQLPEIPIIPELGDRAPAVYETTIFPCHIDHAIIGLMDPAHGPYVHDAWWWRSGPKRRKPKLKEKQYEPVPLGFRLAPYVMPQSAKPYKILGNKVAIEIIFQLPGVRFEVLNGDRHQACAFTAITPLDETKCEVFQSLYWTVPGLSLIKPIVYLMVSQFLGQDRDVVIKQQEGLADDPNLMLIGDADAQARWYFRLKREYLQSQKENRPFQNPIEPTILRWQS